MILIIKNGLNKTKIWAFFNTDNFDILKFKRFVLVKTHLKQKREAVDQMQSIC